jgi:hypothetical protein
MACGRQFRGKVYLDKLTLWEHYLEGKQTLNELAATHSVSISTVQRLLRGVSIPWQEVKGMPNTNNKLEGIFADLKRNINNHSGMSRKNRERFINGFFLALGNNPQ